MSRLAALAVIVAASPLFAQQPAEPRLLPPLGAAAQPPTAPVAPLPPEAEPPPDQPGRPKVDPAVILPHREMLAKIDPSLLTLRRMSDGWQLWAGPVLFRNFGNDGQAAQDALTAVRGLRPTEWGVVGGTRPVVEYGLVGGEPSRWVVSPRHNVPVDRRTVRAEPVRGAWVLADDANILLNFGPDRAGAEQAAAVAKRYGFNRLGFIGYPNPVMSFFYSANVSAAARRDGPDPFAAVVRASQEQNLTRTGVDVPGVGLVGERLAFDRNRAEVRRDRADWVLAAGSEVLAKFGYSEIAARDALRVLQDARFTEFCKVGGLTFFLSNGLPPTRVPFAAQATRFDPTRVAARQVGGVWGVYEGSGRLLFPAESVEEAELMAKVLRAYGFDQLCQVGTSPKTALRFLAKTGR